MCDGSPNPPGRPLADAFAQIAGDDIKGLLGFAREQSVGQRIVSAYCGSDFGLLSVASINRALGLPGLDEAAIANSLHKARANQVLRQAGLPVPQGRLLLATDTVPKQDLTYPLIVKPVDGSGSRGVTRVESTSELETAISVARSVSTEVLLEQVIEGEHLDVSGFFAAGQFFSGGQLERYFSSPPHRYPTWGCQPPDLELASQKSIYLLLEQAARALNLDCGPVKADIIQGSDGPVLIEVTPRFHGDVSTSFVCPLAHGVSPVQQWMQWLASGELPSDEIFCRPGQKAGWAGIFPAHSGTVQAIDGVDDVIAMSGIAGVLLRRGPGWKVERLSDNRAVLGFLFAIGRDTVQIRERLTAGLAKIQIRMS